MKILVLCNRHLLKSQYESELAGKYLRYSEMLNQITVKTYQQLVEEVNNCHEIDTLFDTYSLIICDEAHFFYSDSDFNPVGTYTLLQAIVMAGFMKTMIFITATLDEVEPLIKKTFEQYEFKIGSAGRSRDLIRQYGNHDGSL